MPLCAYCRALAEVVGRDNDPGGLEPGDGLGAGGACDGCGESP